MQELSFNHGRLAFSHETYEMLPALPDSVERRLRLFYVGEQGLSELPFTDFDKVTELRDSAKPTWLYIAGSPGDDFWKHLRQALDLSDEQIKYIRSPHKVALFEDSIDALFWTLQRPSIRDTIEVLETVNFFLMDHMLITRQFSQDQVFTKSIHKLLSLGEHTRDVKADWLAAELVTDLVDSYVQCLKQGGTRLEAIQNKIIRHPGKEELNLINRAQQIIWIYLNTAWPIENMLQEIVRCKNPILSAHAKEEFSYRRDEAASLVRLFETYREMSYDLMDVYVSGIGLRTSETTTVLTIVATLFLPPTLIAGIYGMNFNIPEVHITFGYYICLGAMFLVSGGLLAWMKWKGYIEF
jgi:magnesium transporter